MTLSRSWVAWPVDAIGGEIGAERWHVFPFPRVCTRGRRDARQFAPAGGRCWLYQMTAILSVSDLFPLAALTGVLGFVYVNTLTRW